MKSKLKTRLAEIDRRVHRDNSQGAGSMAGIPWCYVRAHMGDLVDKHPVKRLTKAPRRKT